LLVYSIDGQRYASWDGRWCLLCVEVDELISSNLDLELVDSAADKDLDVLTSLIQDDVHPSSLCLIHSQFTCCV